MIRYTLLTLGLLLLSSNTRAATAEVQNLVAAQQSFVAEEWNQLNCDYANLLVQHGIIKAKDRAASFQPLNSADCTANRARLETAIAGTLWKSPLTTVFPNYLKVSSLAAANRARALSQAGFMTALQSPLKRNELKALSIDPWVIENAMRKDLHVEDGHAPQTTCSWKENLTREQDARANLYNRAFWHAELFSEGYDCTVSLFKKVSRNLNAEKNRPAAQAIFENERALVARTPHQKMAPNALAGLHIAVFPQLAYDAPTSLERLKYSYLKKALLSIGATLDVVDRVSAESLENQVAQSTISLAKILGKYPGQKMLVLTRSMGGAIAREVLERNASQRARVSGVIEIGSTPFGSVIADYKARGDAFDQNFIERHDPKEEIAVFLLQWFNPKFKQLHDAALKRNNIATMSFRLFNAEASAKKDLDLPVLNIIQLPDSLGRYFTFKQSAPVDQAMLFMSMYGPTEGSSPLTHAAWDTKNSVRLFNSDFNHLGFWGLEPDLAVDYIIASIQTAKRLGVW